MDIVNPRFYKVYLFLSSLVAGCCGKSVTSWIGGLRFESRFFLLTFNVQQKLKISKTWRHKTTPTLTLCWKNCISISPNLGGYFRPKLRWVHFFMLLGPIKVGRKNWSDWAECRSCNFLVNLIPRNKPPANHQSMTNFACYDDADDGQWQILVPLIPPPLAIAKFHLTNSNDIIRLRRYKVE